MLDNLRNYHIILASNSPRRRELLAGLGISYEVKMLPDVDESYPPTLRGADIPVYISRQKAEAYRNLMKDDTLLITADTIVYLDEQVLGKPATGEEAVNMLTQLSGRTHEVITGVTIWTRKKQKSFAVVSEVTFDLLSTEEIRYYVDQYNPLDKAGAYGIQEWIGFIGVKSLKGSYFNVMGLPVQRLYKELQDF